MFLIHFLFLNSEHWEITTTKNTVICFTRGFFLVKNKNKNGYHHFLDDLILVLRFDWGCWDVFRLLFFFNCDFFIFPFSVSLMVSSLGFQWREPTSCEYCFCNWGVVHTLLTLSLSSFISIICQINSSETRILKDPDELFWIWKGWQASAFFNSAFLDALAKEAMVTNDKTDWKNCLGRRK